MWRLRRREHLISTCSRYGLLLVCITAGCAVSCDPAVIDVDGSGLWKKAKAVSSVKFSVRGDGLVTAANGLTVTAGGLSVSAGSATITTVSVDPSSESALVVSASGATFGNNASVLTVSTATSSASGFFLFEVRPRGLFFCIMHSLDRGLRCCGDAKGLYRARTTSKSAAASFVSLRAVP